MDYQVLQILNKKRFSSREVLSLVIFRVLKIVLFCLSLTLLFWFFLIRNYLLFTLFLGAILGGALEIIINSRRSFLKNETENKIESLPDRKAEV